jgi:ABC-2 type transport system ATP-binding protein
MNIKPAYVLIAKIVVLTIVMFILSYGTDIIVGQQATEMSPDESMTYALALLVVSLIDTIILTYFILRSRLNGLRLMAVVTLVFYGVKTFTSMLEAVYFMPTIKPEEFLGMFLITIPMVVIFPLVAVPLLAKAKKQPETDKTPNTRLVMPIGQLIGKIVFLSVIVYSILFWAFGYYIALRNPDVAAFYGVTIVPATFIAQLVGVWTHTPDIFVFEFFRGALWVAMAAPIIRTTKGKIWEAALIVALLFALVQNDVHLVPNPWMPISVALTHFIETASSNFIYAVFITWLIHRSHSSFRDLFSFGRAAKPAASPRGKSATTDRTNLGQRERHEPILARFSKNDSVIEVRKFRKTYGDFVAVNDISFEVRRGEIFGLLGPNGAGKTSALESLEGLRPPNGGSLQVAGVDPAREAWKLRNVIGVQLQSAGLPESITPNEAMMFFCAYHDVPPRFDLLERLGIYEKRKAQFHELSTGKQRRLALALAVAHNPQVLFLDEPTAGLDVASRVELHDLMREMRGNGTTIIMATHDMAEAEEMSDRVAILLNGELATTGTPMEITATGAGLTKVSVRTEGASLSNGGSSFPAVNHHLLKDDYNIYFSTDTGPTVAAIIAHIEAQKDTLIDLRVERPSLEDRFLEITTGDAKK